jgi:hypoxanthine-DNA glycosylase
MQFAASGAIVRFCHTYKLVSRNGRTTVITSTNKTTTMTEIIRNRTIRPSTRLEKSKSYKIDTKSVSRGDILVVNIDHETKSFRKSYKFNGSDVAHKASISFRVNDYGTTTDISWSGATPIGTTSKATTPASAPKSLTKKVADKTPVSKSISTHVKTSFDPISNADTTILILGTMPGDKSLELGEYYGHSRNRFWKIISTITDNDMPLTYTDKKALLHKTKIGIWDVAHKANRKGSLDSAIEDEEPNDLDNFISRHKNLKVIAFNGTKSEALFDKYFDRKSSLKYISLPSTSPANTGIDFDSICKLWRQILTK